MKLLFTTLLVWALAVFSGGAHGQQQCGGRVRKNWDALSASEKTTFLSAIQTAMGSGAYLRFIEMHTEMMSEMEAHGQCMFIYWHRQFLLAFENMLRGQNPQFACVTLPYWDWITDNSRYVNGQCRSMGACSSVLQEMGGVPTGLRQSTLTINGLAASGFCVNSYPLNNFCESATRCSRCLPRGNWNGVVPPAPASYASVMSQLFNANSIGQMSPSLERGAHNNIHADMDGAMAMLASPAEPVFWTHHSMVDLLHVIFHKCRVGTTTLTFQQKASHPVAWSSCGRRNGAAFNPSDVITMRTGGGTSGRPVTPGSQDPLISRYFQGVPNRFADLMDVRDLGYSYELSGIVATMYSQCDGRPAPATPQPVAPQPQPQPRPQPVPRPVPVAPRPVPVAPRPVIPGWPFAPRPPSIVIRPSWGFNWPSWFRFGRTLRAATQFGDDASGVASAGSTVKAAADDASSNPAKQISPATEAPPAPPAPVPVPPAEAVSFRDCAPDPSVQKVTAWYDAMVMKAGGPSQKSLEQIERMMCVFQDDCLGGVRDFTPEFKAAFHAETSRCKAIVDDVRAGKTTFCVDDWKQLMTQQFGCPQPKNGTQDQNQTPTQTTVVDDSPVQKTTVV